MTGLILFAAAALATSSSADSGKCDAKPFTLKKPVAATPQPAATPAPKPASPAPTRGKKLHANKYVPGCKQPKS